MNRHDIFAFLPIAAAVFIPRKLVLSAEKVRAEILHLFP